MVSIVGFNFESKHNWTQYLGKQQFYIIPIFYFGGFWMAVKNKSKVTFNTNVKGEEDPPWADVDL